jgi:hypothetical protein
MLEHFAQHAYPAYRLQSSSASRLTAGAFGLVRRKIGKRIDNNSGSFAMFAAIRRASLPIAAVIYRGGKLVAVVSHSLSAQSGHFGHVADTC